ncbi:MAG TPA: acyl-phosphate glycerol 3-phosphate acyltransferase [Thermodesulfobacteriaceae bacterium]|nr:acyl-phosphate glycerol 3-phosphate acyltransferase [Thermodesulfobacteriaceae bacterium]
MTYNKKQHDTRKDIEKSLLVLVRHLVEELYPGRKGRVSLSMKSRLDQDLGLDSLSRAELIFRIEQTFNCRLPEQIIITAETVEDLVQIVSGVRPGGEIVPSLLKTEKVPGQAASIPFQVETLVDVLDWHVKTSPDRLHIHFYREDGREEKITYQDLKTESEAVAAGLLEYGLSPGQTVAIMLPTGLEFFYSFFGVLYAGGVPVPIYPPARLSQLEDHLRRQAGILNNALSTILLTVPEAIRLAKLLKSMVEGLRLVTTVEGIGRSSKLAARPAAVQGDTALLQYTSGSTGDPKGVVLTHANLLANVKAMGQAVDAGSQDVFVSWLPLYHDMGLIGAWLGSLYHASLLVLMSPFTFLARPERWLQAIHRHGGTLSASPNFGYELCMKKVSDDRLRGLDLSTWRMAFNGAEPVSPSTIERFTERFSEYGFSPEAMTPVYGLAECSVGLAFPPMGRGPLIDRIRREDFMRRGRAVPAGPEERDALRFAACGQPLPGHQIRILDPAGGEAPDRTVGHLQFKGPSVTSGYFRNAEKTRELFDGDWLNSGDLAYMADGDVYLTGRIKDIIIRAGRNINPVELEESIGNISGIRKGCIAVFGTMDREKGTEKLVVMAETRETGDGAKEELRRKIVSVVTELVSVPPDEVLLVPPRTVLKTSSGKIRRSACRLYYEEGEAAVGRKAVWLQLARLVLAGVVPGLRRFRHFLAEYCYGIYVWSVFLFLSPLVWTAVALSPGMSASKRIVKAAGRALLRFSGIPVHVTGMENFPVGTPCMVVANHASYLDGLVLSVVLPEDTGYVAKKELLDNFIPRIFLTRLGTLFVERFDPKAGVEDTGRVLDRLRRGGTVILFPEGTFRRMPGLLPFRMGAFVAAAEGGVPVLPVAVRGTRSILRSGEWLPRRGSISVVISRPVYPEGSDWQAALKLRKRARDAILKHCGEPELVHEDRSD